jgi:hypothetical protein
LPALTDGLFVEAIDGLVLDHVTIRFNNVNEQPYWTHICFNLVNAGFPVLQHAVVCDDPIN